VKVEDAGFTAATDTTAAASLCSVFVSVLLTPSADGTFALRWANQEGGLAVLQSKTTRSAGDDRASPPRKQSILTIRICNSYH